MAGEKMFTKDQLVALIKDVCGTVVADVVKAQGATPPPWAAKLIDMGNPNGDDPNAPLHTQNGGGVEKGLVTAGLVRAIAAGRGDVDRAKAWVGKHWGDTPVAKEVTKALAAGDNAAGGFIVPTPLSQDIIELLRPMAVVRRLGPVIVPMPSGTIRIPKLTAGSAATYIGENTNISKTQPTFGQIALTYKKLAATVPVSNDLLRYSSPGADTIVRNDLVRAMAQREDQAFIRDDGTSATPKGIRYWCPAANQLSMTGTDTLADITTDLGRMVQALKDANVPMTRPGWMFSPRTERRLLTIQNTNGFYVYRPEMMSGKLWNYPFAVTTQIPSNLGVGANESEVYLVDFDDMAIGEAQNLIIDASTEAAYDDNGTLRSAFSLDQTVVRAISEHDFAARRDVAIVVLTNATWGA